MKRTVAIITLVCCVMLLCAQNFQRGDTLIMGERWPTYYYWGDNWIDSHLVPDATFGGGPVGGGLWCKPEVARYIYSDTALRVIGIAVAIKFQIVREHLSTDNPFNSYQVEHFRLYEVDSTTGDMILLADKPLTDTSAACYLPNSDLQPMFGCKPSGIPVREVYFDSVITVYDSFYVAATCNNNYRRQYTGNNSYVRTQLWNINMEKAYKPVCYPQPNHYRRKLHLVNDFDYDEIHGTTDTNWHVFHKPWTNLDSNSIEGEREWSYFMMMFPILDTTPYNSWVPECGRPVNFGAIHAGKEVVVLGWESTGSSQWELKVAKEGEDLDTVEAVACTSDVVPLYGLDTASWYVATVRAVCGENRISDWSDTIRFFVPGDTTTTDPQEGIMTLAERYTSLMPNPATEQVTVMSSFRIERVEVYTLTGRRVKEEKVGGLSSQIDISGLAKGGYLVRIHTNHGVSTKRLVVR